MSEYHFKEVNDEKSELDLKINELADFMSTGKFLDLSLTQTSCMRIQLTAMKVYSEMLDKRMSDMKAQSLEYYKSPARPSSDTTKMEVARKIIKDQLGVSEEQIIPEVNMATDLGMDSLDRVELVMAFEDEFGIEIDQEEADKIHTVQDLYNYMNK